MLGHTHVSVEIPGYPHRGLTSDTLPPVGTHFQVHKHLTDGGTYLMLEVVNHEWRLEEPQEEDGCAFFSVTIRTRIVKG